MVEKIIDNIYWVGVKDPGLEVFDIIMETKKELLIILI